MKLVDVDGFKFSFNDDWSVEKYDEWTYYKKSFQGVRLGVKAVDLLALSPERVLFLIEVKDYRAFPRTKASDIGLEVSCKVFDTLAALLPAKLRATSLEESRFALRALASVGLRIVLHLEQPEKHSKLFHKSPILANVQAKLRQTLKAVDPHARVTDSNRSDMPWVVAE